MWKIQSFTAFCLLSLLVITGEHCRNHAAEKKDNNAEVRTTIDSALSERFKDGPIHQNGTEATRHIRLADSTDVVLSPRTNLRIARNFGDTSREVLLDGEAFFDISAAGKAGKPFIIHTRSLKVLILGTRLRVDAYAANAGEEVDLLTGKAKVTKSYYSSTDNEPEILQDGEMVMINRDIDLMEKEKMDSAELKKWGGGL